MAHLPAGRLRRIEYLSSVLKELFIVNGLLKSFVRMVKAEERENTNASASASVFSFHPPPLVVVATHLLAPFSFLNDLGVGARSKLYSASFSSLA
jgi:hypothetical protein